MSSLSVDMSRKVVSASGYYVVSVRISTDVSVWTAMVSRNDAFVGLSGLVGKLSFDVRRLPRLVGAVLGPLQFSFLRECLA